jgi:hypothetical protein
LNHFEFIAEENVLELGRDTDGILGRYVSGDDKPLFTGILLRYPANQRAERALNAFSKAYLPDATVQGLAKTDDGAWNGARLLGPYLMLVLDAPSEKRALGLLDSFVARL